VLEQLKTYLIEQIGSEPPGLDAVLGYFEPLEYKRNELILSAGDICRHCNFIVKGCVQVFVYDKEGNEMTRDFVLENGWIMEVNSFAQQIHAVEYMRAVEPTTLLAINYTAFQELMQKVPPFELMYRKIMETSYSNSVFRLNTFLSMDALERLRWVMEHQPALMTRLSSKSIASYLGISAETLTRLKAKL